MGMWLLLALMSGVVLGVFDIFKKLATKKVSVLNVLALYALCSLLLLMPGYKNALQVDFGVLPLVFLKAVIIYFSWILGFVAFKHLPISVASPFKTVTPLVTILLGITFLGEHLSWLQGVGILVILMGYYIIGKTDGSDVKTFIKNKYIFLLVISAILSAFSGLIDKIALRSINAGQMQFWFMLFLTLMYGVTFVISSYREHKKLVVKFNIAIVMASVTIVLADRLYFMAVAMPQSQLSVILPVRFVSVVVSAIVGGFIFKEENLKGKFLGISNLLFGVMLIFFG